jgi:hypothetical protein
MNIPDLNGGRPSRPENQHRTIDEKCPVGMASSSSTSCSSEEGVEHDEATGGADAYAPETKRSVCSLRECAGLQDRGISQIFDELHDKGSKADAKMYGLPSQYTRNNMFGASSPRIHCSNGTSTVPHDATAAFLKTLYATTSMKAFFKAPEKSVETNLVDPCSSAYTWMNRTADCACWPVPNIRKIASHQYPSQYMTSGPVGEGLRKAGIVTVVVHPTTEGNCIEIPFGPYLDEHRQPLAPGTCLPANAIYRRYGMSLHDSLNEAWRANVDLLACVALRAPGCNPVQELHEFRARNNRAPFWVLCF